MIRLKTSNGEVNIAVDHISHFIPASDNGSVVITKSGASFEVQESNMTIRNRLNKVGFEMV